MNRQSFTTGIDRLLAPVGLFALVAVGQLAGPAYDGSSGSVAGFAARRAIDLLAGVGWLADRLPSPSGEGLSAAQGLVGTASEERDLLRVPAQG
jgi:hypothetical protein